MHGVEQAVDGGLQGLLPDQWPAGVPLADGAGRCDAVLAARGWPKLDVDGADGEELGAGSSGNATFQKRSIAGCRLPAQASCGCRP